MTNVRYWFDTRHPLWIFTYYLCQMVVSMLSLNPLLLLTSFLLSVAHLIIFEGVKALKFTLVISLPIGFFTIVIMPFFSHRGNTPLFYVNDQPVTYESVIYGCLVMLLLLVLIQWFMVFSTTMNSEKTMYLCGKINPKLGLIVSMALGLIPRLSYRYAEISDASKVNFGSKNKIRNTLKKLSILTSFSLESSVETGISMESRGYGIGKRSSFTLYIIKPAYAILVILNLVCLMLLVVYICCGGFSVDLFPSMDFSFTKNDLFICGLFAIYGVYPLILGGLNR